MNTYIHTYTHIHTYIRVYMYMHACRQICMYACMYLCYVFVENEHARAPRIWGLGNCVPMANGGTSH